MSFVKYMEYAHGQWDVMAEVLAKEGGFVALTEENAIAVACDNAPPEVPGGTLVRMGRGIISGTQVDEYGWVSDVPLDEALEASGQFERIA